jgi:RNA polymerase sigma factor for flagellar operon FliA
VLNEDIEKIAEARNSAMIVSVMSLNEQVTILSGEDTAQKVEKDELMEMVQSILSTFNEREQMIIQLYYFEELNLKEISEVLDISESRISQIYKKLLAKIKEQLGINHG